MNSKLQQQKRSFQANNYKRTSTSLSPEEEKFWALRSSRLKWFDPPQSIRTPFEFDGKTQYSWFKDGTTNITLNCVDNYAELIPDEWALLYHSPLIDQSGFITYKQLRNKVSKTADVLKKLGVKFGDRVVLFMPDIQENAIIQLACARIGAISASCSSGFGVNNLAQRIKAIKPSLIVTASHTIDKSSIKDLKSIVDSARKESGYDNLKCLVVQRDFKRCKR